jgi:hypothetical protein
MPHIVLKPTLATHEIQVRQGEKDVSKAKPLLDPTVNKHKTAGQSAGTGRYLIDYVCTVHIITAVSIRQ